jgi:hypothetical protein
VSPPDARPAGGALARVPRLLLDSPGGLALCAGAFFLVALGFALALTFLNDEGLFTLPMARGLLGREFWAFFFLHKGKPANLLLYALPAHFGLRAFLVAHVAVGTAAVVLTGATARRLGVRHPNVAAWVMATSSSFVVATANGYANADGAALVALFLFLYFGGRRTTAAVVLGVLPFSRYELGLVTLLFLALAAFRDRDLRFVLAALALPAAYVLMGAVYHRDLLWLPHTMVHPNTLPDELKVWRHPFTVAEIAAFLGRSFLAHSPVLAAFALLGLDRRDRRSVELWAVTTLFYGGMAVIQLSELQKFDTTVRHHTGPLPLVALCVAYALAPSGPLRRLGQALAFQPAGRWRDAARSALVAGAVGVLAAQLASSSNVERQRHQRSHALVAELVRRGLYHGQTVYTDIYSAPYDRCAGFRETYLLVNGAIRWELSEMGGAAQIAAVRRALARDGWYFDPAALPLRDDALYVLSAHSRSADWRRRLEGAGAVRVPVADHLAYALPSRQRLTGGRRRPAGGRGARARPCRRCRRRTRPRGGASRRGRRR